MTSDLGRSVDQTEIKFLVEKNADGIIVLDEDGRVLFANPAAEQLFGRSSDALVGTRIGIPLVAGETTEISIRKPGGEHVDAEIRCVDTSWNRQRALLASLRDVSVRKVLDEQLRHSAKMEAVGRLTAGIAHDFNNLLTVVLGNLDAAQRLLANSGPAPRRAVENAMHGARRAAVLTERLLAFARHKPLEPCVLDINVLVESMSELLRRTLGEKINVRATLGSELWNVEVDPTELEAAILNLAVNARDAMPNGGELVIETSNVELDAAYAAATRDDVEPGDYVLICVADDGIGMPPDILKLVFEPFFTTKSKGSGTGLGLSQVYGFVKQSGGHVKLYSEPGIGTTAKIYLPKVGKAHVTRHDVAETTADSIPRANAGETVLLVEDDNDVRCYAAASLRELGYRVLEAADATAALQIIEREPGVHLLFTDLGLPGGIDGRMLAKHVEEHRPEVPVLITTAYAGSALIHEGRLDANVELLNKPFTIAALATRVRKLLDRDASVSR